MRLFLEINENQRMSQRVKSVLEKIFLALQCFKMIDLQKLIWARNLCWHLSYNLSNIVVMDDYRTSLFRSKLNHKAPQFLNHTVMYRILCSFLIGRGMFNRAFSVLCILKTFSDSASTIVHPLIFSENGSNRNINIIRHIRHIFSTSVEHKTQLNIFCVKETC